MMTIMIGISLRRLSWNYTRHSHVWPTQQDKTRRWIELINAQYRQALPMLYHPGKRNRMIS